MTKYNDILRLHSQGMSNRSIASICSCSRNTVASVLERAKLKTISWPFDNPLSDKELHELLFPEKVYGSNQRMPDCEYIHNELAKSGVTLTLLWEEYCESCRLNNEIPYMYSQFRRYYINYAQKTKATMRLKRKPGELMEVDWAGDPLFITDSVTGERIPAYLYVAVLSSSQYAYVEAFLSQNQENWINAHLHTFEFFGGCTRIIVPDNLKTGVIRSGKYDDPIINRVYNEMADHYGTAIVPARVRRPKDKPNAEGTVGFLTTWIIAKLRNYKFFSIQELNEVIWENLRKFNEKPFQKKPGSRLSAFLSEEKVFLLPLPASPYELATWMKATVPNDYHIIADRMHYSVPYEYIRHEVDVRVTSKTVEVFYSNHRIASHVRLHGLPEKRSTVPEHMPENHRQYLIWNAEAFIDWATKVGPSAAIVMKSIISYYRVEQQSYRSCRSLVNLGDKYSLERLEAACSKALLYTPHPSLKNIRTILKTGHDKLTENAIAASGTSKAKKEPSGGFVRGSDYYGGGHRD